MKILTVPDVYALSTIIGAAERGAKIRWLDESGRCRIGTARHLVRGAEPSQWYFLGRGDDVRDAFLRVTTTSGMDVALAVRFLMELVAEGGFDVESEESNV
jgi:hypothetical protein